MIENPIIIPAFEPDRRLIALLDELISASGDLPIILIDDGSQSPRASEVIAQAARHPQVEILTHRRNRGKGAALKTAIARAKQNGASFVVTADADGQHAAHDILRLHAEIARCDKVLIGTRKFTGPVPLRSKFGNILTRAIFNLISQHSVADTQSGLRAIPRRWFDPLLTIEQDRYDFEFAALMKIAADEPIGSITVETIYEPGNPTSHFNPLLDSSRIYFVLLRYALLIPLIAVAELTIFWVLSRQVPSDTSFLIARGISLLVYFITMRNQVFRSHGNVLRQVVLFAMLVAINVGVGIAIIGYADAAFGAPLAGYLISQSLMLLVNFIVQRSIIFRGERAPRYH